MEVLYKKSLILISLLASSGALVYRFYSLNSLGVIISLLITIGLFFILMKVKAIDHDPENEKLPTKIVSFGLYLLLFSVSWVILLSSQTSDAITSPWQIVPWEFFVSYFLATLLLIQYLIKRGGMAILLLSFHAFLSFSVLWLVYKIGYGYDPFIHQASMSLIRDKGAIDPKPIYYLGQYALIVIANKLFSIPIVTLDKLLVPLFSAFLLVPMIYMTIKEKFKDISGTSLSILFLLILPFSVLSFTTPQNLAYLFFIITVFYSLSSKENFKLPIIHLLAITSFLIHPLAGIPAILFAIAIHIYHLKNNFIKRSLYVAIFIITIIALPASFYLTNRGGDGNDKETAEKLFSISAPIFPNTENIFLNFAYLLKFNLHWVLILLTLASFLTILRKRRELKILFINFSLALALLVSYFLTKGLSFDFLISYERSDYPTRILTVLVIVLLPPISILFYDLCDKILDQKKSIKYPILFFMALLITASLYTSYPRKDNYFDSHGLSVSNADIEAVSWIEKDAEGKPYVVLANQQVSVAALRKIGFRYLDNGQFFYPIPTGGELYKHYLEMVYEQAGREPMVEAMNFGQVDQAYFVLNEYWWAFDKIKKEAKLSAEEMIELNNDDIVIFKYTLEGKNENR